MPVGSGVRGLDNLYLTGGDTRVLAADDSTGLPTITAHPYGKGCGLYMSSFQVSAENTRLLLNLMLWACGKGLEQAWLTDDPAAECAWYPADRKLIVVNNTDKEKTVRVATDGGAVSIHLPPCGTDIRTL